MDEMPFMIPLFHMWSEDISPWERLPHGFLRPRRWLFGVGG